jgi:alkylation response protein AidB-like acyl-CoA dehydrogenase
MDFELSQEQRALGEALQHFLAKEYTFEARKRILASPHGFNALIWKSLAELGVLAVGLPEEYGGLGGPIEVMVVMEQIGAGLVLEPFLSTVVLAGGLIARHGSAAQKSKLLPAIIEGRLRIAFAHFEPGARYALDAISSCVRDRGGALLLSGHKVVVLDAANADLLIATARDESGGLKLFLLEPTRSGVELIHYRTHDGRSAADLELREVEVSRDDILGSVSGARSAVQETLDHALAALCAEAVGIMEVLNRATLEYLKTRVQFGRPIGQFQVLQHRTADMFIMAVQARSMSLLASGRCAAADVARHFDVAAAKAFIGKAGRYVGQQAVQLHGGMGLSAELIVSHYFKRLTLINATFGDTEHQLKVIAGSLDPQTAEKSS